MNDLLVSPGGESVLISPGGTEFFWTPDGSAVVAVSYRRKKHYTRKDDLIEIYAANPQDEPVINDPVVRTPKVVKPAQKAEPVQPEQTIRLSEIEALAREYDRQQAYQAALKRKDWERLAKLYERLIDEQDVEILLMYA